MVASLGKITSPSQGASCYERDGYYAKDDPAHKAASAWAGKGADRGDPLPDGPGDELRAVVGADVGRDAAQNEAERTGRSGHR